MLAQDVRHGAGFLDAEVSGYFTFAAIGGDGGIVNQWVACGDVTEQNATLAYSLQVKPEHHQHTECPEFAGQHDGGVCVNIYDPDTGAMLFPIGSCLTVDADGGSGLRRFAPQMAPAKDGGVWISWTSRGAGYVRYISQQGEMGGEYRVGSGARANVCVDSQGLLHVVYSDGTLQYRKLQTSHISLTSPQGRTTDRTPTFTWDAPEGATDIMLYYWPKGQPDAPVSTNVTGTSAWTPTADLAPGYYMWSLEATMNGKESQGDAEFYIPPPPPVLTVPLTRLDATNTMPTFVWEASEGAAWYNVQVMKNSYDPTPGSDLVRNEWVQTLEWTPSTPLTVGDYSWTVSGFKVPVDGNPQILGDPSAEGSFQIGAPGMVTIVQPTGTYVYSSNALPTFEWTAAASDTTDVFNTWYQLYLIRDGRVINDTSVDTGAGSGWFTELQGQGTASLTVESNGTLSTSSDVGVLDPGNYGVWIRPTDGGYGSGPWIGEQFQVNRMMSPGTVGERLGFGPTRTPGVTYEGSPAERPEFEWTSGPGTPPWYNVFIAKDGGQVYADFWVQGDSSWQPAQNMPYGAYRWWVRAYYESNGYYGPWLDGAAFQIAIPQKSDPLAPTGTGISATPTFAWSEAEAANGYQIYYQKVGAGSGVWVSTSGQSSTTHTATALSPGDYRWWVSASNAYGTAWSGSMDFTSP